MRLEDHRAYLVKFAKTNLGVNLDDAEDLAQKTLIRAHLSTYRGEASEAVWLLRILVNQFKDHLRYVKRHPKSTLDFLAIEGSEVKIGWAVDEPAFSEIETLDEVQSLLARLRPCQLEAMRLYLAGRPYTRVSLWRARNALGRMRNAG